MVAGGSTHPYEDENRVRLCRNVHVQLNANAWYLIAKYSPATYQRKINNDRVTQIAEDGQRSCDPNDTHFQSKGYRITIPDMPSRYV
jgi:hypothetical protein